MNIIFFSAPIIGSSYGHSYKFRVRHCGQGADWDWPRQALEHALRSFLRPGGPLVDCLILAKAGWSSDSSLDSYVGWGGSFLRLISEWIKAWAFSPSRIPCPLLLPDPWSWLITPKTLRTIFLVDTMQSRINRESLPPACGFLDLWGPGGLWPLTTMVRFSSQWVEWLGPVLRVWVFSPMGLYTRTVGEHQGTSFVPPPWYRSLLFPALKREPERAKQYSDLISFIFLSKCFC